MKLKPAKPYPSFPLSPHANGQWFTTRRIAGAKQFFYCGPWVDDPRGARALEIWSRIAADIHAGRSAKPAPIIDSATVTCANVVDAYLAHCERRADSGETGFREFDDIRLACLTHFLDAVGEGSIAGELDAPRARGDGQIRSGLDLLRSHLDGRMRAHAFNRNISKVRAMLRWAYRSAKLVSHPLHENDLLRGKGKRITRREQRKRDEAFGVPIFTSAECLAIVEAAAGEALRGSPILAMVLLAMNSGWGNS